MNTKDYAEHLSRELGKRASRLKTPEKILRACELEARRFELRYGKRPPFVVTGVQYHSDRDGRPIATLCTRATVESFEVRGTIQV